LFGVLFVRRSRDRFIKKLTLKTKGKKFHFTEKVKALTLQDFEGLMEEAGIYRYFGDYKLKKFYKNESERLIMILNS
jgi:hypothetical protein